MTKMLRYSHVSLSTRPLPWVLSRSMSFWKRSDAQYDAAYPHFSNGQAFGRGRNGLRPLWVPGTGGYEGANNVLIKVLNGVYEGFKLSVLNKRGRYRCAENRTAKKTEKEAL